MRFLLLLILVMVAQTPTVTVHQSEVGPPEETRELMKNPSFERPVLQNEYNGWKFHPYTERSDNASVDGDWSAVQGGDYPGYVLTQALQVFDFRNCVGDVWIHLCHQIESDEPPEGGEMDTCEVALYNQNRLWIATLFHGSNLDASDQWKCDWYRVLNLQDFEEVVLFLDAWDSGTEPTTCRWDHLSAQCVLDLPHKTYVPMVAR